MPTTVVKLSTLLFDEETQSPTVIPLVELTEAKHVEPFVAVAVTPVAALTV